MGLLSWMFGKHELPPPRRRLVSRSGPSAARVIRASELIGLRQQTGWEGAQQQGDLTAFGQQPVPINQELQNDLTALRARSRWLAKNDGYVKRFLSLCRTNVIGQYGFKFKSKIQTNGGKLQPKIAAAIEAAWREFSKPSGVCAQGVLSLRDLQNLCVDSLLRDGEILIYKHRGRGPFGVQYQLIDPEMMASKHTGIARNGNKIRLGVEFDDVGRRTAYYVYGLSSMDMHTYRASPGGYTRIPASDVMHVFINEYPDQLRGIPHLAAALLKARRIGGYEEAEVIAKRVSSSKMAFMAPGDDNEGFDGDDKIYIDENGDEVIEESGDEDVIEIEPGTFARIAKGATVTTFDPQHHQDFDVFMKRMLRGLAAALNVSYHSLASDLEGVNYGSMRGGVQEDREVWKTLQEFVVERVLEPIFEQWLEAALLNQAITVDGVPLAARNRARYRPHRFRGRRWDWVDPAKDVQATQAKLKMGLTSLSQVIEEAGADPLETWEQLKADIDQIAKLGLTVSFESAPKKPADNSSNEDQTDGSEQDDDTEQ